jgi:very-short-patch-repair endonuclease
MVKKSTNATFATHPKSANWSNKNTIKPNEVYLFSSQKFIFDCDKCNHDFTTSLVSVARKNSWCPYCSGHKLCDDINCEECLNKSFESNVKKQYWSNKNIENPREVFNGAVKKFIFDCDKCPHEFTISPDLIKHKDCWCPYCTGCKLCDNINCIDCFNNSFASNDKAQYWSEKNIIKPRQLFKTSNGKYIFKCDKCSHEFVKSLDKMTYLDSWCPYCVNQTLCNDINCNDCLNKSFESSPKKQFWSDKNIEKPRQVFKSSPKKYIFNCDKCPHEFIVSLNKISTLNRWCSYCANRKLCDDEFCTNCFENSFASHEKSVFWSDKNTVVPRKVFKGSDQKYFFNCAKCDLIFESYVKSVSKGAWCPTCKNKTQSKLTSILSQKYKDLDYESKFNWCKNERNNYLPFDFYIKSKNVIVELDGVQHFKQVMNWKSSEETRITDKYKMNCANNNGISVIRILQEDVLFNKYNWEKELDENINKVGNSKKVCNIFMCKNNEYDVYK